MAGLMISFLHVSIGRGHPFYLDGIVEMLPPEVVGEVVDVFDAVKGPSRMAWRLARAAYRHGAAGGLISALYSRLRRSGDYNRPGLMLELMGADLRKRFAGGDSPLVVSHPILAAILRGRGGLIYQHGEVAVPAEALVAGAHHVLVPTSRAADVFLKAGVDAKRLFISGLCVEPALVAQSEAAFAARRLRLAGSGPLTGAFFSSGAEPPAHVAALADAAVGAVRSGGIVLVFAERRGRLERAVAGRLAREGLTPLSPGEAGSRAGVFIGGFASRRELDRLTAACFGRFDYVVAPSHERTNWALGLGLPMFILEPAIGSYAPLNREILLAARVGASLPGAAAVEFGRTLERQRRAGELERMAEQGWGGFDVNGFRRIAADFVDPGGR